MDEGHVSLIREPQNEPHGKAWQPTTWLGMTLIVASSLIVDIIQVDLANASRWVHIVLHVAQHNAASLILTFSLFLIS
jgi:hypothetical protein